MKCRRGAPLAVILLAAPLPRADDTVPITDDGAETLAPGVPTGFDGRAPAAATTSAADTPR